MNLKFNTCEFFVLKSYFVKRKKKKNIQIIHITVEQSDARFKKDECVNSVQFIAISATDPVLASEGN